MNEWSKVAKVKLANLVRRNDFASIASIEFECIKLKFANDYCMIDKFGRVSWDVTGKFDE